MRENRQDINQNYLGNRRLEYGRRYDQSDKCKYCQENHYKSSKCYINCLYCHSIHLKKNMITGLCPKMVAYAEEEKKRKSFVCKDCSGEGRFEKTTEIIHRQSQKCYQERVKQFNGNRTESSQSFSQTTVATIPERRIFKTEKQVEEVICSKCSGKGRIYRFKDCCKGGCPNCNYDQYIINPLWVEERMKILQHKGQEPFQCAICMQDVIQGASKFVLECNHEFHLQCISKWLNIHQKCPICRQVDPYIDIRQMEQFESSDIESLDNQQAIPPALSNLINLQMNPISPNDSRWSDQISLGLELSHLTITNMRFNQQQEW